MQWSHHQEVKKESRKKERSSKGHENEEDELVNEIDSFLIEDEDI